MRTSRWWRRASIAAIPLALLASGGLVYDASTAAFTGTTENPANSWQAGQVSLTDDDAGSAMVNVTGLTPSSTGNRCIAVTYTGDVAATVALHGVTAGGLAPYLNLTVETGTGGTFAAGSPCTGFTPAATIYSGTLANFGSTRTTFATGAPTTGRWAPTANGQQLTYRFTYSVQDNAAAEGTSATATFTWEAQSV